jgi:hypothetical protein
MFEDPREGGGRNPRDTSYPGAMEERVGFEPTDGSSPSAVFKTAAFDRSAISPRLSFQRFFVPSVDGAPCAGHNLVTGAMRRVLGVQGRRDVTLRRARPALSSRGTASK